MTVFRERNKSLRRGKKELQHARYPNTTISGQV
jgi:hypothetical protein